MPAGCPNSDSMSETAIEGDERPIDRRAVAVGALVLGTLCSLPALGLTPPSPQSVTAENPGLITTHYAYLLGFPGPMIAGALARSTQFRGAVEGSLTIPLGAAVPVLVATADLLLSAGELSIVRKLDLVGQSIVPGVLTAALIVPFACLLGGALGWFGKLATDAATGGVRISWS